MLEAGVYSSRPLAPLGEAVSAALEPLSNEEVEHGRGVGRLWRRPDLRSRLVQALADHARRSGAGRIVAADRASLVLASPVAERTGVPLERRRERAGDVPGGTAARPTDPASPYLVACVLHDSEVGRFLGEPPGASRPAGAGIVVRVTASEGKRADADNVLTIIDL